MPEIKKKKILLVTRPIAPPWDEASKNFAYYLAKNIGRDGLLVTLLTNGIIPGLSDGINQKAIYTSNNFSYFQKIRLMKHLRKLRKDFDILHYIFTPTKQNSFLIRHFLSYKKNNSHTIQTIATLREDLYSEKEIRELIFGDLIITYSDYAKNKLASLGFRNVKRIYPGIDLEYYSPTAKDPELLKQFSLTPKDFVVIYPGEYTRLGATDDINQMIIDQAPVFREKNIKIVLANRIKNEADAKKKKEVVKLLKDKGVIDRVVFIDTFSDMAKLYNLSDVVIFPVQNMKGKFDVPLAAVEPMACEKPVIISDLPILREFANEHNSVIIPMGDGAALARAILELESNPEKRLVLGKSARKFMEENFDLEKTAEIYRKIYEVL